MGAYEDSYKSLLQGVSQQVAQERVDGQLTAQDNMLSDVVTGLRRRPGAQMRWNVSTTAATDRILGAYTSIGNQQVHVVLNTVDGVVRILDSGYAVLATLPANAYLVATDARSIQAATLGDSLYLANSSITPTKGAAAGGLDPERRGFYYVLAGGYNILYELKVTIPGITYTVSYSTPDGTTAGDAAKSTPTYIINQLKTLLDSQASATLNTYVDSGYMYIETISAAFCIVSTSSLSTYATASRRHSVALESNLPARLPTQADGFIMQVGASTSPTYYKYVSDDKRWIEVGTFGSPGSLSNMPVAIEYVSGVFQFKSLSYEGRLAGDDSNNADPPFLTAGITGLATYQGRLVLLAGNQVSMSASNKPTRWYRSTVTAVLDADPIHVGSSANFSAKYEHAIVFNKDLILFSQKHQALVPSSNAAINARTATVLPTSSFSADTGAPPVSLGRTLMYYAPISSQYFGMLEMLPSTQADSQYTSFDASAHLPKYMSGRIRASASSTVSNLAVFSPSNDKAALIVHQYQWAGDEKVQQSWSRWSFQYDIAAVYFSGDVINILFYRNGVIVGTSIDPKAPDVTSDNTFRPFADLYWSGTITAGVVPIPSWLQTFDPTATLGLYSASGDLRGSAVGYTKVGQQLNTVLSWQSGSVVAGYSYRSSFVPTPPIMRDSKGNRVNTNKLTVLRFYITTNDSAEYDVQVSDNRHVETQDTLDVATLFWSSPELELGKSPVADESSAIVPCRTDAKTTTLYVFTDNGSELNVTGLEYAARYHQRLGRR